MSAIYEYLGAKPYHPAALARGAANRPAGPADHRPLSDRTGSPRFGRRSPYFLIGAILSSLGLIAMPNPSTLWMVTLAGYGVIVLAKRR